MRAVKIGHFVDAVAPLQAEAPGAEALARFEADPALMVLPVVSHNGHPIGVVERSSFTLKLAGEFGRALYVNRPITAVMEKSPPIVESNTPVENLLGSMDRSGLGALLKGFIVVSKGRYVGVGAGLHILQAGVAIHKRRAEAMSKLAQNLVRAEAEARASSRAKSEFLAVMSHEIRTPLNGGLGVAALMERKVTQESLRPYIRTILDSGQSLLRLLTDALDMSRAEAGILTLETAPMNLASLGADLDALWRPRAEEKALDLVITSQLEQGQWATADEVRLKQLLNNLIGNALKFTSSGSVRVHLQSRLDSESLVLSGSVDDSGPGISEQAAKDIFEPFNTGEAGRNGAGAGLGLAICRQIIERMQGQLGVSRSLQGGARFSFELQLLACKGHTGIPLPVPAPTPHETLHVLVVDDNAANRFIAGKVLELFGCSHDSAGNGREAIDQLRICRYDLILMDIKMPVLDGVEATRFIRDNDSPYRNIPILALTANADPRDESLYLEAGMNGVAQKPIQPDALLNAIRQALAPPRNQEASQEAA